MVDDPFGGVVSPERREALSLLLRDELAIEIQPSERTIAKLRAFIEKAKADMDEGVEWSGSQSYYAEDEGHRLNPLLALTNHLEWLAEVFSEQPSISVTVR